LDLEIWHFSLERELEIGSSLACNTGFMTTILEQYWESGVLLESIVAWEMLTK